MFYKSIRENWRNLSKELKHSRLIEWRNSNAIVRIDRPTRLDRARSLGYRAKQGILIIRVRVERGGRQRPRPTKKGRRSKRQTSRKVLGMNYKWICEQRANRKYKNCEVLGSYPLLKDGRHYFAEIILIDRDHPQIKNDKQLRNIARMRGRVYRGLTSSGRKSRGLRGKGDGFEKSRPSVRANKKRRAK
ncbi:50S ribosomal protein L15e [Candidatus Woesearchaeota archaeon]|nr:50S ribosomal protein L15e [Candidatus Woesearchaeota archaeon]